MNKLDEFRKALDEVFRAESLGEKAVARIAIESLYADALRDAEIGRLVRLKLTSGNEIPVERCVIKASEIAAMEASRAPR